MLLSPASSCVRIEISCVGLDSVQRGNALDRFVRDWAAAGVVQVDELAPGVRPAAQFGRAAGEQRPVACKVIHHQCVAPVVEEGRRMLAVAAGGVVTTIGCASTVQ